MKKAALFLFVILTGSFVYGQSESGDWIRKNGVPFTLTGADREYLPALMNDLEGNKVIALGEASHGTHEFYTEKAIIIKELISSGKYRALGIEFDQSIVSEINGYLQGGEKSLKPLMVDLRLYNTQEVCDLFEWIKDYNSKQPPGKKVILYGFDDRSFSQDPLMRDQWMFETLKEQLDSLRLETTILWAHNIHILRDTAALGGRGLGYFLQAEFGEAYYAMALDAHRGIVNTLNGDEVEAHPFTAAPATFSGHLAASGQPGLFLSFRADTSLNNFNTSILNIYSVWQKNISLKVQPGRDMDGLLFINETTPSKLLMESGKR